MHQKFQPYGSRNRNAPEKLRRTLPNRKKTLHFYEICYLIMERGSRRIRVLTHTIQPLSHVSIEKAKNTGNSEPEEVISQLLAIYDSLYTLYTKLNRLDYVITRKVIATEIQRKNNASTATFIYKQ